MSRSSSSLCSTILVTVAPCHINEPQPPTPALRSRFVTPRLKPAHLRRNTSLDKKRKRNTDHGLRRTSARLKEEIRVSLLASTALFCRNGCFSLAGPCRIRRGESHNPAYEHLHQGRYLGIVDMDSRCLPRLLPALCLTSCIYPCIASGIQA
jgi:hypothetical protein